MKQQHIDHIAEKVYVVSFHYGPAHKQATAAVNNEWGKLKKLSAWNEKQVKSKAEVARQAKKEGETVHFVNLMDLCHVKNAELQRQKSWTLSQSLLVWLEQQATQFSVHSGQDDRISQILTIAMRRMSRDVDQDSSTTKTNKSGQD